jgi:hypothetical protein
VTVEDPSNGGWGIMDFLYDKFYDGEEVLQHLSSKCKVRNAKIHEKLTKLGEAIPPYLQLAGILTSTRSLLSTAKTNLMNELYPVFESRTAEKVLALENIEELLLSGQFCDEMKNLKFKGKDGATFMHDFTSSQNLPLCATISESIMNTLIWNPMAKAKKLAVKKLTGPLLRISKKVG